MATRPLLPKIQQNVLQMMGPDKLFYAYDEDGGMVPRNAWVQMTPNLYHNQLHECQRVALALNDVAQIKGFGRVYILLPHPFPRNSRGAWGSYYAYKELPELFYVPEIWSGFERSQWSSLKPIARLERITGQHGFVDERIPVLPFGVELRAEYRDHPGFDNISKARILLLIGPRPYLGRREDMEKGSTVTWNKRRENGKTKTTREHTKGWDRFEREFRMDGGEGVLKELDRFYREGTEENGIITFGSLMQKLLVASEKAIQAGKD